MSEATLEDRRQAVEEVKGEVLALLANALELLSVPPVISAGWAEKKTTIAGDLKAIQELARRQQGPLSVVSPGKRWQPGPLFGSFGRLLWLLGLSPEERAFVEDAAREAKAADPAGYCTLAVFCDWLKDQGRQSDAASIEVLVPEDGSVIVITVPDAGPMGLQKAYDDIGRPLKEALDRLSKRVHVVAVRQSVGVRLLSYSEMRSLGWVRADDRPARVCVCEFFGPNDTLSRPCAFHANEISRAVMAEREACAALCEALSADDAGPREVTSADRGAEEIRKRPPAVG